MCHLHLCNRAGFRDNAAKSGKPGHNRDIGPKTGTVPAKPGHLAAMTTPGCKGALGCATEISIAVQVAFIIAGCTHVTYYKVLKHALGIEGVSWPMFDSTIKRMYPIVKEMVDKMCSDAKDDMQCMDQNELGSWSRAVTSADGTWMTRGHHSKNATFSI